LTSGTGMLSATKMLDAEDYSHGVSMSKAEKHRKKLAEQERESDMAAKLAAIGSGSLGGEYMKHRKIDLGGGKGLQASPSLGNDNEKQIMDASSLGLIRTDASTVNLESVRGKKKAKSNGAAPMGWGGAFKRDLLDQRRDEENEEKRKGMEQRDESKTRSAMVAAASVLAADIASAAVESSDDDLDIV
jgi:minichromosome maintenance protein 10